MAPGVYTAGDVEDSMEFQEELVSLLPRLRRHALARVGHRAEADDLVQAACERALQSRHQWNPGTRLDAWVLTILNHLCIDAARRRESRGTEAPMEVLDEIADVRWSKRIEASIALEQVLAVLQALPDPMRAVLSLVAIDGLSYQEAAGVLQVPVGTVMSRLSRARLELMRRLGVGGGELSAAMS